MEYKMKKRNVFFCKAVIVVVSMMSMVGTAFARIPSPVQLEVSNGWNLICSPHKGWVPYDNPTINEYIFNTKRGYYVRKKYLFTYIEGEYRQHPFVRSLELIHVGNRSYYDEKVVIALTKEVLANHGSNHSGVMPVEEAENAYREFLRQENPKAKKSGTCFTSQCNRIRTRAG